MRAALLLAMASLAGGCASTLPQVRVAEGTLRERIHRAKFLGAMECAPADLATAQASYRFALDEIRTGDLPRATDHLDVGLVAVQRALDMGPFCPARGAPVTDLTLDPWSDADGDAVADEADACPSRLEDLDGYLDGDGCPEPDNDEDGLLDADDACPMEAEDLDGYEDEDGCPEPDNDGDGIADADDSCPLEPETVNQLDDDDGCPDFKAEHTTLDGDRLTFIEPVRFSGTTAILLADAEPAISELAAILTMNPTWAVRIEGHTDNRGEPDELLALSQQRAAAIGERLVAAGIPAERIQVEGIGGANPITTNRTAEGREVNNRIEVFVVEMNP